MFKKIIINADDLGLSPAVNQAIFQLAEKERISSASFMSYGDIEHIQLIQLIKYIEIGLHLDFTALSLSRRMPSISGSLKEILIKSYLRRFSVKDIQNEIHRQLDLFETKINQTPAFIDGHQHVHQLPQIRDIVIQTIQSRYDGNIAVRITQPIQFNLKSWIIYALGGYQLKRMAIKNQIITNFSFGGVYGFNRNQNQIEEMWKKWFQKSAFNGGVIMCHPAVKDVDWQDEIQSAREIEFEWLNSSQFMDLLSKQNIKLQSWQSLIV